MHVIFYFMSIGENIKKLRKDRGLTQVQLADQLRTTQKVITDYEAAEEAAAAYCQIFQHNR